MAVDAVGGKNDGLWGKETIWKEASLEPSLPRLSLLKDFDISSRPLVPAASAYCFFCFSLSRREHTGP